MRSDKASISFNLDKLQYPTILHCVIVLKLQKGHGHVTIPHCMDSGLLFCSTLLFFNRSCCCFILRGAVLLEREKKNTKTFCKLVLQKTFSGPAAEKHHHAASIRMLWLLCFCSEYDSPKSVLLISLYYFRFQSLSGTFWMN